MFFISLPFIYLFLLYHKWGTERKMKKNGKNNKLCMILQRFINHIFVFYKKTSAKCGCFSSPLFRSIEQNFICTILSFHLFRHPISNHLPFVFQFVPMHKQLLHDHVHHIHYQFQSTINL